MNRDLFGKNILRVAAVGTLAILALFLFAETIAVAQEIGSPTTPPADTITVSGQGQAALAPDIAYLTFSVENSAADVATAQSKTTTQANAAITWIEGQGVAAKDVTTLSYNISPQYSSTICTPGMLCPNDSRITGYQVSESVKITVHDLSKVSPLLAGLGQQNVENVTGPSFGLADPNAGQDAARAQAIAAAKQEAQAEARALGVSLGRIVSFSDNGGSQPYPVYMGAGVASADKAAPLPNIPAGENTYSDTVSITYAIR